MRIVMVSNGMSHHQLPLCDHLSKNSDFTYVALKPVAEERLAMGYTDLNRERPYILCAYKGKEEYKKAKRLIDTAETVICGSVSLGIIARRVIMRKPVFWASERIFKKGHLTGKAKLFYRFTVSMADKNKTFLLAASAYAANDFASFGMRSSNMLKWGYFPPVTEIKRPKRSGSILWTGRFLDWKHPEMAVKLAKRLKDEGLSFHMTISGDGALAEELKKYCVEEGLSDAVTFTGFLSNKEITGLMSETKVFIATSDRQEGWGAVISEAMCGGCAVVASSAMGAAPFLIKDGENGFLFPSGEQEELERKVIGLLRDEELCERLGREAEKTIHETWNGTEAGKRLIRTLEAWKSGEEIPCYDNGPCSKAGLLKDDRTEDGKS